MEKVNAYDHHYFTGVKSSSKGLVGNAELRRQIPKNEIPRHVPNTITLVIVKGPEDAI